MKRVFYFALVMVLAFSAASCGKDNTNQTGQTGNDGGHTGNEGGGGNNGGTQSEYADIIHGTSWIMQENAHQSYTFIFDDGKDGRIHFYDIYEQSNTAWGVDAYGNYTITDNKINALYDDVDVTVDADYNEGTWHGFTSYENKKITYTIESCTGTSLVMKSSDGKRYNLKKDV